MKKISCALFGSLLLLAACTKDKKTDLEGEWLFPIAKGNLSINTISQLRDLQYHISIPALSINQPENIPVSSPGLHLDHVGPFPVLITDWLRRLDLDTLELSGTLQNFFPIPIGAGTLVTMRNARDTSAASIVGSELISTTVAPGQQFSFDIQVRNKTIYDSVYFYLDNFVSPAYNNVVFATTPTKLDITLKVITANYLQVYTNRTFGSNDTTDFDPGSQDLSTSTNGTMSDTGISGHINVFTDNGLPANVRGQLYFLDASRVHVIDSLFDSDLLIQGGQTEITGNTTAIESNKTIVTISRKKLNNIRTAKYVASRFLFNTNGYPGTFVAANSSPKLVIQFTGDLNLQLKF